MLCEVLEDSRGQRVTNRRRILIEDLGCMGLPGCLEMMR
jgi:hypothetical protein